MIAGLGIIVLWLIGGGLLAVGAALWLVDGEASRVGGMPRSRLPKVMVALGLALLALMLAGCATPVVTTQQSSCSALLPGEWKQAVAGAPLPDGETVGDWVAFADAQTGKLDQANGRTKDAIGIVERCEERDAKAVHRATRGFFGRMFGS